MADRIVPDDFLTCDRIDRLSMGAELMFRRLLSVVDDFGRFDGRAVIVFSHTFPLKFRGSSVTEVEVDRWLGECEEAGLLVRYVVDGHRYVQVQTPWEPRAKTSRYPSPDLAEVERRTAFVAELRKLVLSRWKQHRPEDAPPPASAISDFAEHMARLDAFTDMGRIAVLLDGVLPGLTAEEAEAIRNGKPIWDAMRPYLRDFPKTAEHQRVRKDFDASLATAAA